MKCRYIKAVLVLLLSLQFAALHAVADNQKGINCSQKTRTLQKPVSPPNPHLLTADPYQTAYNYLVTFYPRWFTWEQGSGGPCNHLIGPIRISPIYQAVVAINDDTLYTSAFIGAADEPAIVTIPQPDECDNYSVLHLDENGALGLDGMSGTPQRPRRIWNCRPQLGGHPAPGHYSRGCAGQLHRIALPCRQVCAEWKQLCRHDQGGGEISQEGAGAISLRLLEESQEGRDRHRAGT